MQLPQLFQQFAYLAGRIARQVREFVLGDGHEVAEQAAVPSQQHRDEVVQLAAVHPDAVQLVALDDETDAGRVVRFVGQDHVAVLLQDLDRLESCRNEKAEPRREIEHVERERSAPAVADGYAQIVEQRFVHAADRLFGGEVEFHAAPRFRCVVVRKQRDGVGRFAVASRAPGLLIVCLERVADIVVHDETDVGLVDSHAECVGRDHDARRSPDPLVLTHGAHQVVHTAVIESGRYAVLVQKSRERFGLFPRSDVDDARSGHALGDA